MRKPQRIIATGFASPADDFLERPLDLNQLIVKNRTATFFFRYEGDEFKLRGIKEGNILVVDRSIKPASGQLAVIVCGGDFLLRELKFKGKKLHLLSDDAVEDPALCGDFEIWGIVTYVIRKEL